MDNLFGELRLGHLRLAPLGARRRTKVTASQAAAEYTGRWGWAVATGDPATDTPATGATAPTRCPCGSARCAAPGLHPVPGTEGRGRAARAESSVLFPTGRAFDVLDVPEQAGLQALVRLERMGTQVGPVLAAPTGRLQFLVAAGTARRLPDLLYRMGWDDAALDLICHGEGSYVAAPPTVLGGLGPVRWLRRPTRDNAGCPPEARLLLGTLAYACHRGRERTAEPAWIAS
ncbi:bifunctional DNA primase/polymerase-like protein [Streptomyces sp. 1114.5]|uniref:bifunctional DNA primase/polymerase n=1 Tax=Streptomyces sp. 1114.5 TaxID=1938830 RepID=UPI000EAC7AE0|nr:bifunctional DNA primase/polymerase [Streptomyces sp. 1114.5]RKT15736.1 bifunctional DNA primase/polymerase-like protein [Streptomyces sp. 1114.5]